MAEEIKIQILVGHCLGGVGHDARPGDIMTAPPDLTVEAAKSKVRAGWARIVPDEPVDPVPEPRPGRVEMRDPGVEIRDPNIAGPTKPRTRRPRAGGGKTR